MSHDVIELNGKRYDARTGVLLDKSSAAPKHEPHARPKPQHKPHQTIDGFHRAAPVAVAAAPAVPDTPAPAVMQPVKLTMSPVQRRPHAGPKPLSHHRPQGSKTLMRRVVHKPQTTLKPAIKLQPPAEVMAKPASAIAHKRSAASVDPGRLQRARQTVKHHAIRHFINPADQTELATTRPAVVHVPVLPVRPAPVQARPAAAHSVHPHAASKKHEIFEKALAQATSHQQPHHKPPRSKRRRLVNSLAMVGAFLVIAGFVGYLNLPMLQLRVASMHAGFGASMPDYTPTGYALQGGVQRSGGTISLSFRSGDSQYTITQQASNWNSQTLLDNTLALNGAHQTVQKNGQTIYIYDQGTHAAWVNGNVRYDVSGNAQLSHDDITSIAASL